MVTKKRDTCVIHFLRRIYIRVAVRALVENSIEDEHSWVVRAHVRAGNTQIVILTKLLELCLDAGVADLHQSIWDTKWLRGKSKANHLWHINRIFIYLLLYLLLRLRLRQRRLRRK